MWFQAFLQSFWFEVFILGPKYQAKEKTVCTRLNFLSGRAKLAQSVSMYEIIWVLFHSDLAVMIYISQRCVIKGLWRPNLPSPVGETLKRETYREISLSCYCLQSVTKPLGSPWTFSALTDNWSGDWDLTKGAFPQGFQEKIALNISFMKCYGAIKHPHKLCTDK